MVYFFHHYELPVIVQQAQLQQLLIRNNQQRAAGENNGGGPAGPAGGGGGGGVGDGGVGNIAALIPSVRRVGFIRAPWLLRLRRNRVARGFNDSNNNMNDLLREPAPRSLFANRFLALFRGNATRIAVIAAIPADQVPAAPQQADQASPEPVRASERGESAAPVPPENPNPNSSGQYSSVADTRSNFQRNYEENNFLFPPDILMRERDRPPAAESSAVPNREPSEVIQPALPDTGSATSSSGSTTTTSLSSEHDKGGGSSTGSHEGL